MRHLVILLAIILTYSLPSNHHEGSAWFAFQAIPSTILVTFLFFWQHFKESKYIDYIIAIEIMATTMNLLACVQYGLSLKTAFIYSQYEHIMTSLFIAEIAVMGVVMLNVGYHSRHRILSLRNRDYDQFISSDIYACETNLCKIQ